MARNNETAIVIIYLLLVFWFMLGYFFVGSEKFIFSLYVIGFFAALFVYKDDGRSILILIFGFIAAWFLSIITIYICFATIGGGIAYINHEYERIKRENNYKLQIEQRVLAEKESLEKEKEKFLNEISRIEDETLKIKKRVEDYTQFDKFFHESPFKGIKIYQSELQKDIKKSPIAGSKIHDSNSDLKEQIAQLDIQLTKALEKYNHEILNLKGLHQQYLDRQYEFKRKELEKMQKEHFTKQQMEREYFKDLYK